MTPRLTLRKVYNLHGAIDSKQTSPTLRADSKNPVNVRLINKHITTTDRSVIHNKSFQIQQ